MNENWLNPCKKDGTPLRFDHLGGTAIEGDPDSWYPELWDWVVRTFDVASVLDVGCGVGFSTRFFYESGLLVWGLDAEPVLEKHLFVGYDHLEQSIIAHDLTTGCWTRDDTWQTDLVWCCEVAEHIEERFVQNVVDTVTKNCRKVLAFCAAPKGAGGYHHVNCQDPPYWIEKLEAAGLTYRPDLTEQGRALCPEAYGRSPRNYFRRSGLIFTR
jgi:SAM-dependent methyltransferase